MPNPYIANQEAAQYIGFFGSQEMQKNSVDRLHYGSVRHKQDTLRKVEDEMYGRPVQPIRSQKQIDQHLSKLYGDDRTKRSQNLAKLDNDVYGPMISLGPNAAQHMDPANEKKLVKRVYTDAKKRVDRQKAATKKHNEVFGIRHTDPNVQRTEKLKEEAWRPALHSPVRKDVKLLLASESVRPKETIRSSSTPADRKDYFHRMAKPLKVTPKAPVTRDRGFEIYPKYH